MNTDAELIISLDQNYLMRLCVLGGLQPKASLFCVKSEVDGLRRRLSFLFLLSHSIVRERVKLNEKCVTLLLRNVMRPTSRVKKANKCPQVSHYRDELHVFSDDQLQILHCRKSRRDQVRWSLKHAQTLPLE